MGKIYEEVAEMVSCAIICIQSFMMPDTGVQAILRFYLSNLRGCNYDIADGSDL
jgi:hypothetical protein